MKFYFAPMEGITDYLYRRAYHESFCDFDAYFTPFLVPHDKHALCTKDQRELGTFEGNGYSLVPQILTNQADEFIRLQQEIRELGFREVNLNLGCPSGTVVSKGRGSGFLAKTEELEAFLDTVFEAGVTDISIKTRLGMEHPEEFRTLLGIYNRFPIKELIIHPRVRTDYYKNTPNFEMFAEAIEESKNPICYNGDIFCKEDYEQIVERFPKLEAVMIGRGAVTNPGLLGELLGRERISREKLQDFVKRLYSDCKEHVSGEKYQLFRMKEYWYYLIYMFEQPEKHWKELRKTQRLVEYESVLRVLFSSCPLAEHAGFLHR